MVTFPQRGHLAGMLALSTGVAIGSGLMWLVLLIAIAIGLTFNRSAFLALLPPLFFIRPVRLSRVIVATLAVVIVSG